MKFTKYILVIIAVVSAFFAFKSFTKKKEIHHFNDGDVILQTSQSQQCEAVRIATNSKFSHCGIIFNQNGKSYVYEAVQPVTVTPLEDWITHGKDNKYLVRRLVDSSKLDTRVKKEMLAYAKGMLNKDYDIYFEWSDSKIYCSEYVWKIYKNAAKIELCDLEKLQSFQLDHPVVKTILKQRYGNKIPLNEEVVAPSQLATSNKLVTIFDNY